MCLTVQSSSDYNTELKNWRKRRQSKNDFTGKPQEPVAFVFLKYLWFSLLSVFFKQDDRCSVPRRHHRNASCQALHFFLTEIGFQRYIEQKWGWSSDKKILILRKRKYRKSCYTLRRSHRDARETVDGIIFAFQGTSPNSRAAHPRQESPGSEGKDSVLLITSGVTVLTLPLTNLG